MRCINVMVKSALTRSGLEGIDYSLNPYIGCSHRCIYCYSPYVIKINPVDFWDNVRAKINLPILLQKEVRHIKGRIFIGSVTDPYQPCEITKMITRKSIQVLMKHRLSFTILTKSDLITRDLDLLNNYPFAEVGFTLNTLNNSIKKSLEIGSPSPESVLNAISRVKIKKYVMIAPLFSSIKDELREMFEIFTEIGVEYVIMDRFRYREGMPKEIIKNFYKNEEEIKVYAKRVSVDTGMPVYFVF